MILSNKHKFISIAIPKTGTSSIHKAFSDLNDESLLIVRKNKYQKGRANLSMYKHIKGIDLKKQIKNYDEYFKFAFIRNPWDRVVSWFKYYGYEMDSEWLSRSNLEDYPKFFWYNQSEWLFEGSSLIVNYIGRFENLQQDFDTVCDKIGIDRQPLPHKNATNHKHYTEYYDDETREIVAEKYAKDIDYFGYKFGV